MSELLVIIVVVFIFAVLLNVSIFSCICISIQRGKKLEILGTMDNFFYMKLIRRLLILSSFCLLIESIGFLVHYSYHNNTTNATYNEILYTININIIRMENEYIYVSDLMIYFGFLLFLLSSVGAHYIALHRFLLTNQQSNASYNTQIYINIICLICYIIISLTAITFSIINLFITLSSTLYYLLLICFDIQLFLSNIPVLKSLKQVIEISRDSAKSVRWSVTNVSPSKLFYKMSVKAVRMSMENIILNILLIADIALNLYQIIEETKSDPINGAIPHNIRVAHLFILYFIQLFMMLWLNDYTWINRKYITVRKITTHHPKPTHRRYMHSRSRMSDFDYNNTVLRMKRNLTPSCPIISPSTTTQTVQLKAAPNRTVSTEEREEQSPDVDTTHTNGHVLNNIDEFQFLKMSDKIKLRSISSLESSTYHSKRQVNKEILSKTGSFEPSNEIKESKRRRSVLSRIPIGMKRMSRTFVETVISADKIWDECDVDDRSRRWSRYNKTQKSKSSNVSPRRHSMPSNIHTKTESRRKSFDLRVKASLPLCVPSISSPSPLPTSPLSHLDETYDAVEYPNNLGSSTVENNNTAPNATDNNFKFPPPLSTIASPKTYSQRKPSHTYTEQRISPSDESENADKTGNTEDSISTKKRFFSYQHKLLLVDRMSALSDRASESPSLSHQTLTEPTAELSRLSDLAEITVKEIKTDVTMDPIAEEEKSRTPAKGQKSPILSFISTAMESNISPDKIKSIVSSANIEEMQAELNKMSGASTESHQPNIAIVINDEKQNKADGKQSKDDNMSVKQENLNAQRRVISLQLDMEELDDILQCIDEYQ